MDVPTPSLCCTVVQLMALSCDSSNRENIWLLFGMLVVSENTDPYNRHFYRLLATGNRKTCTALRVHHSCILLLALWQWHFVVVVTFVFIFNECVSIYLIKAQMTGENSSLGSALSDSHLIKSNWNRSVFQNDWLVQRRAVQRIRATKSCPRLLCGAWLRLLSRERRNWHVELLLKHHPFPVPASLHVQATYFQAPVLRSDNE